jgi:hypothetical protein
VIGVASFAVVSLLLVWGNHDRPVLRIQAAFGPNACCSWQVWIQGLNGDLTVLPLQAGTDNVYTVPIYRPKIHQLFITAGTQPGGTARISRIWITRGSRTVSEVSPQQLSQAVVQDAKSRPVGGGIELTSTGEQPAIGFNVALDTHESWLRIALARAVSERLIAFAAILGAGTLLVALIALDRRRWPLAAAAGATLVGVSLLPWLSRKLQFHDDLSQAVGYASYVGLWKGRERFISEMTLVIVVLAAATVGLLHRRLQRADDTPGSEVAGHGVRRLAAFGLVGLPTLFVAVSAAPNLRLYIGPPSRMVPSWDANNFIFWQYLIQKTSLEPVKDFYWPYSFQWVFDEAAPWGQVSTYTWFLVFWLTLALGTYVSLARFFSGRSFVVRYVLLTGLWLTAFATSDMPFQTRYIGPLGVVLLFAGIDGTRDSLWSWRRIVFALAVFQLTVFEVAQTAYALIPIGCLAVGELIAVVWREPHRRIRWAGVTVATVTLPLAAACIVYAATGTAAGTVDLYRAFTFSSAAYAFPSQINEWISHPTTLEGAIFWAVPLTIVLGLTGFIVRRGRLKLPYAVVTALGLLGFMIIQKQILREHIATQIWLPMVFGLAYWAVTDTVLAWRRRWSAVLAVAGAATALVLVSGGYRYGWDVLRGGPTRLQGSAHALIHDRGVFAAQAHEQFTPPVFANFSYEWPVVRALQSVPTVKQGGPVWILGDDSSITEMLGRSWPYYFNDMYDASPISFQKQILSRLRAHPPARVVWNFAPHAMVFDDVPMPVRVPLLYTWAVENLVPARRVGTFEILRRRAAGEPIDLAFWRRRIGVRMDLGHLPAAVHLPHAACKSGAPCGSYLVVTFPKGTAHPPQVVVPVHADGLDFELAFEPGPESTYVIPLDRVWFWAAATGPHWADTAGISGSSVGVVQRRLNPNVLY